MATIEFKAMGCHMFAALDQDSPRADRKLARVPEWFDAWEQVLSRFRADSELSRVNRSAGAPVQVSQTFWEVFQAALRAEQRSSGLVTPLVLEALAAAGYRSSFESLRAIEGSGFFEPLPADGYTAAPASAAAVQTLQAIKIDPATRTICLPAGALLDFGGVAKGWAAHQAVQHLQIYGPALVSAGGDIAVTGRMADGRPWPVGVADPFEPDAELEVLALGRCGVATSGRDYRRWQQGGAWKHHIIDPRRGQPAQTDVLTATVIAPGLEEAEMAAKVLLIQGSQAGLDWLEGQPGLAALMILEDGQRIDSRRLTNFIWRD